MKNKFNIGDKVIHISNSLLDDETTHLKKRTIKKLFHKDNVTYYIFWHDCDTLAYQEKNIYTKEEAIEFLKGVL